MSFSFLFGISVLAGFVGSMSGIGGGIVLLPVLTACGLDIKKAIAISSISVIAVSSGAAPWYMRRHVPNLKACAYLEIFAVAGAFLGASIAVASRPRVLFFLCGGFFFLSSLFLRGRMGKKQGRVFPRDAFSRWLGFSGSYYDDAENQTVSYQGRRASLGGPLVFIAGAASGFFGIGGSAMLVLIHDLVLGFPSKVSLTMSNLLIGTVALAGACVYLEAGLIDPQLAVVVLLGVPAGAFFGSKLLLRLTNRVAQTLFFCILILLGGEMIFRGIHVSP